jgi:hypothetical protein
MVGAADAAAGRARMPSRDRDDEQLAHGGPPGIADPSSRRSPTMSGRDDAPSSRSRAARPTGRFDDAERFLRASGSEYASADRRLRVLLP